MMNRGWGQEQVMGWGMMGVQISFVSLYLAEALCPVLEIHR